MSFLQTKVDVVIYIIDLIFKIFLHSRNQNMWDALNCVSTVLMFFMYSNAHQKNFVVLQTSAKSTKQCSHEIFMAKNQSILPLSKTNQLNCVPLVKLLSCQFNCLTERKCLCLSRQWKLSKPAPPNCSCESMYWFEQFWQDANYKLPKNKRDRLFSSFFEN